MRLSEGEAERRRQRAVEAQSLLDNKLFQEAWEAGRVHYIEAFEKERDPRKRDELWRALGCLRVVREHIEMLVKAEKSAQEIFEAKTKKLYKETADRPFSGRKDWKF